MIKISVFKKISQVYQDAKCISFDDMSRIVLLSDCHRGDGSGADNFARNHNIYMVALAYYYKEHYMYIELGDGDELWENKKFSDITKAHRDTFALLSKYYQEGRYHAIYGNHDMVKQQKKWVENNLYQYLDEREEQEIPLFSNIQVQEGIILRHADNNKEVFLLHGHQADFLNYQMWAVSRFLVRYLWRPLELIGVKDPTSASSNPKRKISIEQRLMEWSRRNNTMLVAGHTHRTMFPKAGTPMYFNDGCCVNPCYITAIEILNGEIMLVRWYITTSDEGMLMVGKERLTGPYKLEDYFVS